jgi:DnaK suppressor protein
MSTTIDTEQLRQRMLEERRRVVDAIDNIHAENPGSIGEETEETTFQDNHLGDIATATFDREMASTLEDNSTHVLTEIDAALKRIDDGTFGVCTRCGKPISPERLEALPWATLCIDDKRKQERG